MIYIVFVLVWFLAFLSIINNIRTDKFDIDTNKFDSKFHNKLYELSFRIPFTWFVEDDKHLTQKGKKIYDKLKIAKLDKNYTVRSFMTLKVVVFFICVACAGLTILIMKNSALLSRVLLNIELEQRELTLENYALYAMIWLTLAFLPNLILDRKVKKVLANRSKDVPILQMFIILMLRANKTITDILYSLTKVNTYNRGVFDKGYRIYLRNKGEGIEFLKNNFKGTTFEETFNLLEDMGEYAREDCIRILESNMNNIVDETTMIRRKNDLTSMIYTQASMIFPFAVIILLGALPFVVLGINLFMNSGLGVYI